LLSLYLVSTTELYQFLKMPVLIEHYLEHKGENPKITLVSFIKMHYDNPVKDADYKTDQQLPFISHGCHLVVVFTLASPFTLHFPKNILQVIPSKKSFYKSNFYNLEILNSIWQPPKFC
ncbi:MAG: hypothetical protein J0I88_11130, partial [Chryseobacterium sp.]|nr:hypothetical protein [Chryseobacterium sp.]